MKGGSGSKLRARRAVCAGRRPARGDEALAARRSPRGDRAQTLLGVTGSGKTMAMARTIELVQKPTLVLCHNKTLAAQLCAEFREFFPNNAVEYFVSYFDYYQPEAYVPSTDTYIEKDSSINDEIERLRHSATQSLLTRPDTLIVASVSCIFGLGSPSDYMEMSARVRVGEELDRDALLRKLVDMQYRRNDLNLFAARSACAATCSSSSASTKSSSIASSSSATRSRRSTSSTCSPASTSRARDELTDLSRQALHHARRKAAARDRVDRGRARGAARVFPAKRQAARSAAARDAHALRSRHAARSRLLQRHRELLAAPDRPRAGLDAVVPDRFLSQRLAALRRRVARDAAAGARHVRRRPFAQGDPGRARLPAAQRARQPSAYVRRVRRAHQSSRLRFGDAGRVRNAAQRAGRRDDHPADGARGPRSRGASDAQSGRRSDGRDPPARRAQGARAGHHAHEEDGGRPHRLLARERVEGALPAQRSGHARTRRDPARLARGRLRRAGRHQSAARRARPARSLARRHPRCR